MLIATASGVFIYLISGYPNPEVESFYISSNDTGDELIANVETSIRNIGGEGEVRVEARSLNERGAVIDSNTETVFMAHNETREFNKEFNADNADDIGLAVFAPGRPQLVRDESEILERIER